MASKGPLEPRQLGRQVADHEPHAGVVERAAVGLAQMRAGPLDHRRLDLDDRHLGRRAAGQRLGQRKTHAQAAQQQARPVHPTQRLPHERALGAAVSGVHQERAVRDHLVMAAGPPQHQLAEHAVAALEDLRPRIVRRSAMAPI